MNIFNNFDYSVLNGPEFSESGVREALINPLLYELGYKPYGKLRILYDKKVSHPFVQTGSKKREIVNIPDYLLEVDGKYAWVLDAKNPNENILSGEHKEQVYFYAIHPDIRVDYYALCNGKEFVLYHISKEKAVLYFHLSEINDYLNKLKELLSPDAFIQDAILQKDESVYVKKRKEQSYLDIQLPNEIKVKKQKARRHFGVHGYFTRQSWDVVQLYIKNFSKKGDTVLDPFGGSGVTAIESLMLHRKGIHIDLNPISVFWVNALANPINYSLFNEEYKGIVDNFKNLEPKTVTEINAVLSTYPYPKNVKIDSIGSDVDYVHELFTDKQLADLALLKHLILNIKNENIRNSFLLAFSSTITKYNLTFHSNPSGGGMYFGFYYRYRLAPDPTFLDLMNIFNGKVNRLLNAKKEIQSIINEETIKNLTAYKGDATNLDSIKNESIDYIYTDPPYGAKIAYLDLSQMWNAWLGFEITQEDFEKEAIEGGSRKKSVNEYNELIAKSITELYRVLKFNRWMSFVFYHKDPAYWHLIVNTAENAGFEYAGTVKQNNGQSTYKKRQNPYSILSGQLIINFKKVKSPVAIQKLSLGIDIYDLIIENIESVIAQYDGATIEQINDRLIIDGLDNGYLHILKRQYKDFTPILEDNFEYQEDTKTYHIKKDKKFQTNIPLDKRLRYYLLSYLRRKERLNIYPTTDEIILDIMPLLKNGITPENQTILKILEIIANRIGVDQWKLKKDGQQALFE